MAFMLGGFTQGLTEGARSTQEMYARKAEADRMKAGTDAQNYQTGALMRTEAALHTSETERQRLADTASAIPIGAPAPVSAAPPANNDPVAPLTFGHLPVPNYMQGVTTQQPAPYQEGDQSAPGSASGFAPSMNPEAGPVAAAQNQQPVPTGGNAMGALQQQTMQMPSNVPTNMPVMHLPTLASNVVRAAPPPGQSQQQTDNNIGRHLAGALNIG